MTRDHALDDPEVRADLALRDRTARERADRRGVSGLDVGQDIDGLPPALARLYDSAPDPDVEHWPCRGGCGRMIGPSPPPKEVPAAERAGPAQFAEARALLARMTSNDDDTPPDQQPRRRKAAT